MPTFRSPVVSSFAALVAAAGLLAGCGSSGSSSSEAGAGTDAAATTTTAAAAPSAHKVALMKPAKVTLSAKDSKYGKVLFNADGQVVYAFENDTANTSNCSGECADFWPPVLADGAPSAADGVDGAKLGTIDRPDGSKQVTYNGWPLYYMDEPAGEIHCQNMDMHGGLWWVVAADGNPVKSS